MPRSSRKPPWPRHHLECHATRAARELLGHDLLVREDATGVVSGGRIVEVEAYRQSDPACHAFAGQTARNASLFLPAGHLYVYRSYGIHWCVNVVCEGAGDGAAVLIRALSPTVGIEAMRQRRRPTVMTSDAQLMRGPGNLCRALGISNAHDGLDLYDKKSLVWLQKGSTVGNAQVRCGPRIGITKGIDSLWRFWLASEEAVSSPRRGGQPFFTANRPA